MSHVFISYSRRQQEYARALARHLGERHGIPVWIDDALITGDRWENVIRARLDTCSALVVVMSADAETSEWVNREIARAQHRGKPVLPLLYDGEVFFRLSDVQFEDVRDGRMPGERFVAALRQATGTPARPAEPPAARHVNSSGSKKAAPGKSAPRKAAQAGAILAALAALVAMLLLVSQVIDKARTARHDTSTTGSRTTTTAQPNQLGIRIYDNSTAGEQGARAARDLTARGWNVTQTMEDSTVLIKTSSVFYRPGDALEGTVARELGDRFGLGVHERSAELDDADPGLVVIVTDDYRGPADG